MRNLLEEQIEGTQKGARWLDGVAPNWYKVLDLVNVNIFDARSCICTKLVEFGVLAREDNQYSCSHSYGFVPYRGENEAYEPANQRAIECWQKEIEQRKFYEEENKNHATNGAKYLDDIIPDWYKYIKIEKLDFIHPDYCVCGQLRSANKMSQIIFMENYVSRKKGFIPYYDGVFVVEHFASNILKNTWKAEIEQRLEADKKKEDEKFPPIIKIRLTRQDFRKAVKENKSGPIGQTCVIAQACKRLIPDFQTCGYTSILTENCAYNGGNKMKFVVNHFDGNHHDMTADNMYKHVQIQGWLDIEATKM